jgi:hypothetical protein
MLLEEPASTWGIDQLELCRVYCPKQLTSIAHDVLPQDKVTKDRRSEIRGSDEIETLVKGPPRDFGSSSEAFIVTRQEGFGRGVIWAALAQVLGDVSTREAVAKMAATDEEFTNQGARVEMAGPGQPWLKDDTPGLPELVNPASPSRSRRRPG